MSVAAEPVWAVKPEKVDAVVKRLVEVGRPRKIFLFGSYVRGQTHRDSDLDIVVVRESVFEALKDKIGLIYREALRHGRLVYDAGAAG